MIIPQVAVPETLDLAIPDRREDPRNLEVFGRNILGAIGIKDFPMPLKSSFGDITYSIPNSCVSKPIPRVPTMIYSIFMDNARIAALMIVEFSFITNSQFSIGSNTFVPVPIQAVGTDKTVNAVSSPVRINPHCIAVLVFDDARL